MVTLASIYYQAMLWFLLYMNPRGVIYVSHFCIMLLQAHAKKKTREIPAGTKDFFCKNRRQISDLGSMPYLLDRSASQIVD